LADVVGTAAGTQCGFTVDAFGTDSPLRDSDRFCDWHGARSRVGENVEPALTSVQIGPMLSDHALFNVIWQGTLPFIPLIICH
jgi:hypothetical protein